jgi:hypothetical protein
VASEREREAGNFYVEMNFGQLANYRNAKQSLLALPEKSEWIPFNGGVVSSDKNSPDTSFKITGPGKPETLSGIVIPIALSESASYTLQFKYRANCVNISTRLWDKEQTRDEGLYNDEIPASPTEWKIFSEGFVPGSITGDRNVFHLYIGKNYFVQGRYEVEVKDLEVIQKRPVLECYHPLEIGNPSVKTLFIFVEPADSLRELRIASQVRLAEARGFKGTQAEKIFYADQQMLTWITEPRDLTPHVVPSLGYSPDMYQRDSFWTVLTTYDKKLSETIWTKWASTQDERGCIGTIITPYVGSEENIDNDATWYFIIWAYVNKDRYGSEIDVSKIQRALDYCRMTYNPDGDGVCRGRTPGWIDTIWIEQKPNFAINQGIYANVLRCAKELGANVTEKELNGAKEAYRALYDPERGYVVFADEMRDIMSPSNLQGEFISWWLWNEPILSDEAVINTLDKLPLLDYGIMPCIINRDCTYFTKDKHPFDAPGNRWEGGEYCNGGSWFLYEYQAYVAGLKHGWKQGKERMEKRVWAEFNTKPDEPLSHEWLPTNKDVEVPPGTRVFGWNAFMIIANEVAGLRQPEQDPDFGK